MIVYEVNGLKFRCKVCGNQSEPFLVPAESKEDFWVKLEQDEMFCSRCFGAHDSTVEKVTEMEVLEHVVSDIIKRHMN